MSALLSLGDGNQGSIPTREPKKAAGVQITRSWHREVATRNIDGLQRAGVALGLDLPACAPSVPMTRTRWPGCLLQRKR